MPKFLSLLPFQPPFSYYCWQTTQRCCTQVSPQSCKTWLLQGHSKHWVGSAGFLCCVPGEAASCVEATGSKIHWKVFGTSIEGQNLQNSSLFTFSWRGLIAQTWYQTICMKSCWTTLKISKMTKRRIHFFVSLGPKTQGLPQLVQNLSHG